MYKFFINIAMGLLVLLLLSFVLATMAYVFLGHGIIHVIVTIVVILAVAFCIGDEVINN